MATVVLPLALAAPDDDTAILGARAVHDILKLDAAYNLSRPARADG